MDNGTLNFILGISGGIVSILFAIIGFFIKSLISDLKKVIDENGKNKGRIELVEQKINSDLIRIEQTTQLKLDQMNNSIQELSKNVNTLVSMQIKRANLKNREDEN
jgi:uncharacterized protein YoxC